MKMRFKWKSLACTLVLTLLLSNLLYPAAVNAESSTSSDDVTVVYDSNGADSGSVPVDSKNYKDGDQVQVLNNTGGLTRSGYKFGG